MQTTTTITMFTKTPERAEGQNPWFGASQSPFGFAR